MASVWSATNVFTDRSFAIKFMLPHVARTPEAARRFLLEAKISGRINHPNVVEMIDVGQAEDGSLFLVMELLSGISLDDALRRRDPPMQVRRLAGTMHDVAKALAESHRLGIVHRDLKPTNIFLHVDRDGRVVTKLLDFGVSKVLEEDACDGGLTAVGTILGSPFYMSPEQATGADDIDGRTDIFAFGSILFEALCGERAFDAASLSALLVAIATAPPKNIDDFAPQMPQPLRDLVRDCLVPDREKRIASFIEVLERLEPLLPILEESDLAVPAPKVASSPAADPSPSGGSAPPRRRASDRPSPLASLDVTGGSSPPISIPMSAPIFVPDRSLRLSAPIVRRARPFARSAVVLGATAVILVVAGFARRGATSREAGALPAKPPPASAAAAAPARDEPSRDVPTVSVDALPIAAHVAAPRPRLGRLTVTAKSSKCSLTIDGVSHGPTPLRALELSPGIHQIDCARPGSRVRTVSVEVKEGGDVYYQFSAPAAPVE